VTRDATQSAFTYVLRFGSRDIWKIGHAVDVQARLTEVNKHVPYEVLGERWSVTEQEQCPSETDAYQMEQRVLTALRTPSSVGERVCCSRRELDAAWRAAKSDAEAD
jgi:hypothetical protein